VAAFVKRDLIDVDGRKAVRQRYSATYRSLDVSMKVAEFSLRFEETMVSSPSRTHFVTLVCDAKSWDACHPRYQEAIATFRQLP
jgi:hypothetical protein